MDARRRNYLIAALAVLGALVAVAITWRGAEQEPLEGPQPGPVQVDPALARLEEAIFDGQIFEEEVQISARPQPFDVGPIAVADVGPVTIDPLPPARVATAPQRPEPVPFEPAVPLRDDIDGGYGPAPGLPAAAPGLPAEEQGLLESMGVGVSLGGAVVGFTDGAVRDYTSVGGGWQARVLVGTESRIGVEAAYVGSANGLQLVGDPSGDSGGTLLANGAEAGVRVNLLRTRLRPYVSAGLGWKHYEVTRADARTSSLFASDNVAEVPLGVGLGYHGGPWLGDLRATYRPTFDDELMDTALGGDDGGDLGTWNAAFNLGYAF